MAASAPAPTAAPPQSAPTQQTDRNRSALPASVVQEGLRKRIIGSGASAGCIAAGVVPVLLLGMMSVMPLACLGFGYWALFTTPAAVQAFVRWYDPAQAAVLMLPLVPLGACAVSPLGALWVFSSSLMGALAFQKPTPARIRSALLAALPGSLGAMLHGGVVLAGVASSAVLVMSLAIFQLTFSPSEGPFFPLDARLWHHINNVACCMLGCSLLSTPLLLLAWPVVVMGTVAATGVTVWRTGKARAVVSGGSDCGNGVGCGEGAAP